MKELRMAEDVETVQRALRILEGVANVVEAPLDAVSDAYKALDRIVGGYSGVRGGVMESRTIRVTTPDGQHHIFESVVGIDMEDALILRGADDEQIAAWNAAGWVAWRVEPNEWGLRPDQDKNQSEGT